jgi:hypothetical protein
MCVAGRLAGKHLRRLMPRLDIGKELFHFVGFDPDGKIVLRRKIKHLALVKEFEKLPSCLIGMEA